MKKQDTRINFLGKKIVSTRLSHVLKKMKTQVESGTNLNIVFTPNPEQLVYAKSHSSFDKYLGQADYLLPDGIGIVLGSRFLALFDKSNVIQERITGVDVVSGLLQGLSQSTPQSNSQGKNNLNNQTKVLILGGRGYTDASYQDWKVVVADSIQTKKLPEVKPRTLFWHEGFLNVTLPKKSEQTRIEKLLKDLKPDVVFVAFGAPHQEGWIIENKELLESSGVRLVMAVGGTFDMLFGKVARAPKWVQAIGLEWLFRLYQEPWRWRRQMKLFSFVKLLFQEVLR